MNAVKAMVWAALCAATVAQTVGAATVHVRQTVVARQSMPGRFDAAYLDGNDAASLVWGTCPALSFVVGDSCAVNLRTACSLTGTNALTATLAKDSGTLPAGCSAGTNGLTGTVTGALAPSVVVWRATDGAASVTAPFSITATAAPAGDTTAPTIPTSCSGTGGTGTVTIGCDQSSDPYVGEAGSGVVSYRIYLGGVLVDTKTAPSANIQSQMSGVTIGTADGTQSCTRTGANLAMSGGGAGLGSTADQLYGCGYAITGDFIATAKITGFAGAVSTGTAGWMVRASNASGAVYGTARARDSDDKANNRYRLTTYDGSNFVDAAAANGAFSVAQTYPYWLRLAKTATGITPSISGDGNTFTALESERAIALGTSPQILAFHASGTAGTNSTSGLEQVNIANATPWTFVHTTNTGGSYQVSAVDAAGNESAKGAAFTATPISTTCTAPSGFSYVTIHEDDFEVGAADQGTPNSGDRVDSCKPTSPMVGNCLVTRWTVNDDFDYGQDSPQTLSSTHARSGSFSARAQLTHHNGSNAWYGTSELIAKRNEVSERRSMAAGNTYTTQIGGEDWYGVSIYLPGDTNTNAQFGETDAFGDPKYADAPYPITVSVLQFHDSADAAGSRNEGGACGDTTRANATMLLNFHYEHPARAVDGSGYRTNMSSRIRLWNIHDDAACTDNGGNGPSTSWDLGSWHLMRGHWTDWIFRWKTAYDSTGILQVWRQIVGVDAEPVLATEIINAPTTNNDLIGNYAKVGLYEYHNLNLTTPVAPLLSRVPQRVVVYHDAWKHIRVTGNPQGSVAADNCAYRAVAPSGTAH